MVSTRTTKRSYGARLKVVGSQGDQAPLSPTYGLEMNSFEADGQQSNIVFQPSH